MHYRLRNNAAETIKITHALSVPPMAAGMDTVPSYMLQTTLVSINVSVKIISLLLGSKTTRPIASSV